MNNVKQCNIRNGGGQQRVTNDVGVGNAHVLDHEERRCPHDGRHDLAIDRRSRFNGTGTNTAVAGLFHERNGENTPRDHIGHGRGRHNAIDGRRHHGNLGGAATQMPQQGKGHLHHVVAGAAAIKQ